MTISIDILKLNLGGLLEQKTYIINAAKSSYMQCI